jgi:hypothetical protein
MFQRSIAQSANTVFFRVLSKISTAKKAVGYISDIEGNYDYWQKYIFRSKVLYSDGEGRVRLKDDCHFVCGGDICDRGVGDIRILRELLSLKRSYPDRVHFILGNRDINKLRLPVSLHPSLLSHPPEIYWFNSSHLKAGKDFHINDKADRLKWVQVFIS